ncbi:MAG: efflux RND transporter periplasmic adaptor subunit [Pirellulales bacterium]|nr:efflux RND transporter periplasmic adaptor subunit [Pirellulales bacterium]
MAIVTPHLSAPKAAVNSAVEPLPENSDSAAIHEPPALPASPPQPVRRRPIRRRRSLLGFLVKLILPLGAVGLLGFAVKHVNDTRKIDIPVAPPVTPAKAPFSNTVAGNGMIEAQTENIAVGTPVPGLVIDVFVKEGDKVKALQPLFRLDDRQLQAELKVRQADVVAAKSEVQRLENEPRPEEIPVQEAMVVEAEANVTQQADSLRRTQDLYAKRVSTEQELTQSEQNYRAAVAKLNYAKAQMSLLKAGAWQYQKDVAKAAVEQAQSQVDRINTELDRLTVRAYVDGEVLQVNVRPGEYVGAPSVEPLVLLGDVSKLHVRVDIDENDIPRFVPGKPAVAALKGSPNIRFPLGYVRTEPYVVPKRSLTGMNTERVDTRVLQVIYSFDPSGLPVHVGQQVEVFIEAEVASHDDATKSSAGSNPHFSEPP